MFKIYDGRSHFWQWDSNQKLVTSELQPNTAVHFCSDAVPNKTFTTIVEVDGITRVCKVPNVLLTHNSPIKVYAYIEDAKGNRTIKRETFMVKFREKPSDYIYTETQTYTLKTALVKALTEIRNSGEFDGKDGVGITDIRAGVSLSEHTEVVVTLTDGIDRVFHIPNGKDGSSIKSFLLEGFDENEAHYSIQLTDNSFKSLVIPLGKGKNGADGVGITDIVVEGSDETVVACRIDLTDGTSKFINIPAGPKGEDGKDGDPYVLTEDDKNSMVQAVLAALPDYREVKH